MKDRQIFILNTLNVLQIIILYYIVGTKSLFLYTLSLSLYNIFISCFNHISIKDTLKKLRTNYTKTKLFKLLTLVICVISLVFLLLSILSSDIISLLLKINNILPVFIMEGIAIFTRPFISVLSEYLENTTNKHINIITIYNVLDKILLLLISLFVFRIFKLNNIISISLLYLSKILATLIIVIYLYTTKKINFKVNDVNKDNLDYKKEIKYILANNSHLSIIKIVKYSYYYISVIILYLALSTRYNYKIGDIENIITFTYFYGLVLINYIMYIVKEATREKNEIDKLYNSFKVILTFSIILSIISPLICKVIFNDPSKSIYFTMIIFLAIFILLCDITYDEIKNKIITYISLSVGLLFKIILVIPLINSFYRMGYDLLYGDITSTIIGMFLSTIINYIYMRNKSKNKEKYFPKILDILYENIILAIILILVEFIIPIDTANYFKSLGLIFIYLTISITYINLKNKKWG